MIYFIFPLFFSAFYFSKDKYIQSIIYLLFLISMVLFAGLRWETGTDWIPYYENFLEPDNRSDFEIGYSCYVSVVRFFTDSYTIFLLLTSAIPIFLVYYGCKKVIGKDRHNTLLLALLMFYSYYYLGSFLGAERRIIAIGLSFLALSIYINGKTWCALLLIFFASLFHVSSLFTVFIFLSRWISIRSLVIIFFTLAVIFPLFHYMSAIVNSLIDYVPIDLFKMKLIEYTQNAQNYGEFNFAGAVKRVFIIAMLLCVFYFDKYRFDEKVFTLLKVYILGGALYLILSPISAMFSVLTIYLTISEILLIPIVITQTRLFIKAPFFYLIFIVYLMSQTYSILNSYPDLFYPYIDVISGDSRLGLH